MNSEAWEFKLFGLVQGVGFRPFVHRLSQQYHLNGWVLNSSSGLIVLAEGITENLKMFAENLMTQAPPMAEIEKCKISKKKVVGYKSFSIRSSENDRDSGTILSPDTGICEKCLKEFYDIKNRRHNYLMISCAECGPRFSMAHMIPYDRENTSMNTFTMCPECRHEYHDIYSRRYHTEAIACSACGPHVWLADGNGKKFCGLANELLKRGKIIAVKGIGGFHLACNALNEAAIASLRNRKKRDSKPFAVMCRDLKVVKEYCQVGEHEVEILKSKEKPIVLLGRKSEKYLSANISPGINTLGVMLPYTPVHYSLFDDELEIVVLTSANLSDEPLIDNNEEALEKLNGIADFFLLHDRPIINSCDDSVVAVVNSATMVHRRARGYVPLPIRIEKKCSNVFACGGDLKNTFCILKGQHAFISQHFGDLSHYGNYRRYLEAIERFKQMTGSNPKIIAHDLHPGYISTQYAKSLEGMFSITVQHHHAHFASCMAENNLSDAVLGVICDGTGYGTDGCIWGFEFFYGDYGGIERLAHLDYLPLSGGDDAVYDPSRTVFSYLYSMFGNYGATVAQKVLPHIMNTDLKAMQTQLDNKIGIWNTSSCGRLFDAISALLGVCTKVNYEGQAAMLLEAISCLNDSRKYRFELDGNCYPYHLNVRNMFEEILFDMQKGISKEIIGGRFHATIIDMVVSTTMRLSREKQCQQVVLSGGVFQNRLLLKNIMHVLENNDLRVYIQRKVPTNDGGLSLGQAVVGEEVFKRVSSCNRQSSASGG
ncbi:hydrogenase maturation protein HypF [Sporomusaceae bacterium BoRhaA]|uniref:carbamoyltransferase HypF n=1 Tax=Pelorhabdus rhamnosifermentans TaxID=2772457 RepID=UPI001C05EEB8|nr:carbamoyltransferase HypF [Pelorhabdus rhamnosifermentans]MBU2701245.1 hydrogenase maturation protein HypF [Pelorhabdus rhamnosifermentans]